MPFIDLKTTAHLTKETETDLTKALGKAIEALPGKSETWLMLSFTGDAHMAFRGTTDGGVAMFEVKIYGKASPADYDRLTKKLCAIAAEKLGIAGDRVYVKYEETEHWGFDGYNF